MPNVEIKELEKDALPSSRRNVLDGIVKDYNAASRKATLSYKQYTMRGRQFVAFLTSQSPEKPRCEMMFSGDAVFAMAVDVDKKAGQSGNPATEGITYVRGSFRDSVWAGLMACLPEALKL